MRIGIDLDDTICNTTEIVQKRAEKYASIQHLNPLDIMNDEALKNVFFRKYLEDIYTNVEIKEEARNVLKRIKNRGNQLYIITARDSSQYPHIENVMEITSNWLKNHNIKIDEVIIGVYGEEKANVCKEKNIDLMIDDDPYNYKMILAKGIKCLLFDDYEKYDLKDNYVTNWLQIEKYIERNR